MGSTLRPTTSAFLRTIKGYTGESERQHPVTLLDMGVVKYNSSFKTSSSISIPVECDGSAVHKASRSIDPSFAQGAQEITYR